MYVLGGFLHEVTGILTNRGSRNCFDVCLTTNRVERRPEMPVARFAFGAVFHKGSIYVVSGIDQKTQEDRGQQYVDPIYECDCYKVGLERWAVDDEIPPELPEGRTNPSLTVIADNLYVIGGIG